MSDPTIHFRDVLFHVIPLASCLAVARGIGAAGSIWHSHVLSPGCAHNPYAKQYALVIEDDDAGIAYIAPSDGFPEVDKDLVRMLHGDDILDPAAVARDGAAPASEMLSRLREIDGRRVAWHHHMHFPSCILSPHRGHWAISIESAEGGFSEAFPDEPVDVLREVEVLYFANLERSR